MMNERVAIVGLGSTGFRPVTPDLSYRELIFQACTRAYDEAGLHPNDIDSFITAAEDFIEGYSIADEYCNDQLGAVQRPVHTVPADFLQALGVGVMMINTGQFRTIAIEAHSKASNLKTPDEIKGFALDPIYLRNFRENADFIAGLEMQRFLADSGNTEKQCAEVVVKNRRNALKNMGAAYGAAITADDVLGSHKVATPLTHMECAQSADGGVVVVLAAEKEAKKLSKNPIWINGISWASAEANVWSRNLGTAEYAQIAAKKAYSMAGISNPQKEIDFAEVCDEFSYKELQHMEALGLAEKGQAGKMTENGDTAIGGKLPVNASGGALGTGNAFECNGGAKIAEAVMQLRGQAGARQVENAKTGLVQIWRGVPTGTGAVAVLGRD
jgi:acetyl-CoA C-acetyltransferase